MKALVLKTSEGASLPWVRIPPTPPTMAIGSQRNLRAFLFAEFVSCEMLQRFTPHRVCHPNPLRHYGNQLSEKSESFFCIQKPRHCGGVKKSLSGEQRKEAPNVIIY